MENGYEIPKTNAEGLALVWTRIYPAELARQLTERFETTGAGSKISRAATAKWKAVPQERVNDVADILGIPREHILPEVYAAA